ncbi:MAG: hypothetical protein IJT44_00590 [Clostridia bacterium]|nr:hypothetical protein [Clostridia bacterium]
MKMAKRVLAIVVTVIMVIGTCAIAVSASYQDKINSGNTLIELTGDTRETLTINSGDVTIDLKGYDLKGEYGKSAIIVNGGNVTVRNGRVSSWYAQVKSADLIKNVFTKSPSGITVNGGSLTVEGCRVIGSMARVPTTTDYFVPTGSAIMSKNGATVTLRQASLIGDYGVNNKVTGSQPGGEVHIEDAIIVAYNTIIKDASKLVVENGTQKINAADRVAGFLNDGITLTAHEKKLIKDLFDERAYVFTKEPTDAEVGTIYVTEGQPYAEVVAPDIEHLWDNITSTDCSYKLVAESVKLSDGTTVALDKVDAAKVDTDAQIVYRVYFNLMDDTAEYLSNIDEYIDLAWWANYIEEGYQWLEDNSDKKSMDSYEEVMDMLGEVLLLIDKLGVQSVTVDGQTAFISDVPEWKTLRQKIFAIGGAVVYNHGDRDFSALENNKCGPNQYRSYNGLDEDAPVPANYMYGTLDRVEKLRVELREKCPNFRDTSKWADTLLWVYDNYNEVLDILHTLVGTNDTTDRGQLGDLQELLKGDMYQAILDKNPKVKENIGKISKVIEYGRLAYTEINKALAYSDVQATINAIDANRPVLKDDINKVITILENYRTYFTPEDFIIDGAVVKGYLATPWPANIEYLEGSKKLDVRLNGLGYAKVTLDGVATDDAEESFQSYEFEESFTLTAVADEDFEFLYWVNAETGRIYSTEPTIEMNTAVSRSFTAYFGETAKPNVTFVSVTGQICGFGNKTADGDIPITNVSDPYIPGYAFVGWTGTTEENRALIAAAKIADADKQDYYAGSSPFAVLGAYYGQEGALLSVRPGSEFLMVLPEYSADRDYKVYFVDGAKKYVATAPFGSTATYTAVGENFSYWKDRNNNIVCLTPEFNCSMVREMTYTAVYNDTETVLPDYLLSVTGHLLKGDRVAFFVERSVSPQYSGKILTTGAIVSYSNPNPVNGGEGCMKGTAKVLTDSGAYIPTMRTALMTTGKAYVRPYIEIEGIGFQYGETYTYGG